MVAKAEATYSDNAGKSVTLEVTDTGGAAGLVGLASWMGVQGEHEDNYRKTVTRQEGDNTVHEEVRKDGSGAQYSVILARRFVVSARGHGVGLDALKSGVASVDLAKLAALK
jgi:hypothetical protein